MFYNIITRMLHIYFVFVQIIFAPCRELSFFSLILDAKAAQVVHRTVVDIQVYLMVDARKFAAISVLPELPFALIAKVFT